MTRRALRAQARADARVARGWSVVGIVGELLVTAGLLLMLFVAWQLWWTDVEAGRTVDHEVTTLRHSFDVGQAPDPKAPDGLIEGETFALLHIPRLGADWVYPIKQGTDLSILSGGLGHYVETAPPGEVGNFAVGGHRTTWGRPFHDIETRVEGDRIVVETGATWEVYAVTSHEIVSPYAVEVIAPVPDQPGEAPTKAMLTLTTCHPKFSAEQRYIVHAELLETRTREEGLPASVLAPPSAALATTGAL